MSLPVDMGGNYLYVNNIYTGRVINRPRYHYPTLDQGNDRQGWLFPAGLGFQFTGFTPCFNQVHDAFFPTADGFSYLIPQ